jgi:hypothetical protein
MSPSVALYCLQILNTLPGLIAAGQSAMGLINAGTVAIQNMVAENRNPTPEEWAALDAIRDGLHKQIQS